MKRKFDAYANKLEVDQEDYLELILRDAEAEKLAIRNSNKEQGRSDSSEKTHKAIEELLEEEELKTEPDDVLEEGESHPPRESTTILKEQK